MLLARGKRRSTAIQSTDAQPRDFCAIELNKLEIIPHHSCPQRVAVVAINSKRAEVAGEAWNSVRTAAWMSAKLGRVVRANRGRETLQRLGFSTKTPRPQHAKADVDAQDLFKKNVS